MAKPCPNCGAPKHPLKICGECGFSARRQSYEERVTEVPAQTAPKPKPQREDSGNPDIKRKRLRKAGDERVVDWWLDPTQQVDHHFIEDAHLDLMDDPARSVRPSLPLPPQPFDWSITKSSKLAITWLEGTVTPQPPMTKLFSQVDLYDGWNCPGTRQYALELVQQQPEMNFQVLQAELRKASATVLEYRHIWWYYLDSKRSTALYKDANNLPFILVDDAWHLGYSLGVVKGLAYAVTDRTAQSVHRHRAGFFLCWENEQQARDYNQKRTVEEFPLQRLAESDDDLDI